MKSPQQKKQLFEKEMKRLKKEGALKEKKKSFFEVPRCDFQLPPFPGTKPA